MPDTPRTIQNIRDHGFTARCLCAGDVIGFPGARWQVLGEQGLHMTELLIVIDDECEAVYWLSPSTRLSDDIEALRRIAAQKPGAAA